ncbi:MAG: hypothetical protein JSV88_24925 [Candidatus Aminicenantes bacterium]|nr:MAG: hypothetical protein JSV88_24925 [Candidatus Aminicenantes bacterium]
MQKSSKLFLETTIQIDRFSADTNKKEKINKQIAQSSQALSSTYVKMEFKRRFIQDVVYLYNEALSGATTFPDVFFRIDKLRSDYHKRKIKGIIASFHGFFSDIEDEELHGPSGRSLLEKAVIYFKSLIENAWEDFSRDIDKILNGTDCYNAKIGPTLTGEKFDNRSKRCKKGDIKCKIVEFFMRNRESFIKIYRKLSHLDCLDDEQQKVKNILEKAIKYPEMMADRKNCWNCGDAIIAVESPSDAILFTTNIKHFEPICSEIKKKCLTPLST